MVADQIQEYREKVLHYLQFSLVKGRSVMDMLYRSVRRARQCLDRGV